MNIGFSLHLTQHPLKTLPEAITRFLPLCGALTVIVPWS